MQQHEEVARTSCPYCGESIQLVIDCSIPEQHYVEDCEVCCRPIEIRAICNSEGVEDISVRAEFE